MTDSRLLDVAAEVQRRAGNVDLSSLNEANTKALLIEPMLVALGWDVLDLAAVTREYPVYDGTFLDYALLVAKRPALFCEAKPTRRSLDDPKWVSQTINYANNEGVIWCVLTDGLRWRVFKANEAAPMDKKLAFEVTVDDLFDQRTRSRAERLFACLTPAAVADGELTRLGTQVFVDGRVQATLIDLLENPPARLVDLLRTHIGNDHGLKPADVRGAIARVARPAIEALETAPAPVGAQPPGPATEHGGASDASSRLPTARPHNRSRNASYAERLQKWPAARQLHDALTAALAGRAEITEQRLHRNITINGTYVGGIEALKTGLKLRVPTDLAAAAAAAPALTQRLVDVAGRGRWAKGLTEVTLTHHSDIPNALALLLPAET